MSRVGSKTIEVPDKVKVAIADNHVSVEGPKGKLEMDMPSRTTVSQDENVLSVARDGDDREAKAMHGLGRSLLNNMVVGVSEGYVKKLEINGVGFKAAVSGNTVTMNLGYSHPIKYDLPNQVTVSVDKDTNVTIEGPDKQKVGLVAAELRGFYPVEPYKGKGVKYAGEYIRRKEGKTVQYFLRRRRIARPWEMRADKKRVLMKRRRWRIRKKVVGTVERPRMSVRFTNKNIYVQFIDDDAGNTLASVSTRAKSVDGLAANTAGAGEIGKLAGEAAKSAGIKTVVFDRSGARFHGKIKALADAARKAGISI